MSYIRGLNDTEIEMPDDATVQRLMAECRADGVANGPDLTECVNNRFQGVLNKGGAQAPPSLSPIDQFVTGVKDLVGSIVSPFTGGSTASSPPIVPGKFPVAAPAKILGLPRTAVIVAAAAGAVLLAVKVSSRPKSNPRRRRRSR